jgi:predicted Zn-dependent protease
MRILLLLALVVIGGGGYLAYLNDGTVTLVYAPGRQFTLGVTPLLLACVTLGLAMGIGGAVWNDLRSVLARARARRRRRHAERLRHLLASAGNERLAGRVDKAVELYRRALKLDPENLRAVSGLGNLLRHQGKAREAISLHRLALRLDPERLAFRLAVIDDYIAMESYESASQQIRSGLKDDPRNQALAVRLRDVQVATADWAAAAEAQEQVLAGPMDGLDSRHEAALLTGFRYEAAVALLAQGKATQAREGFVALTRHAPDFAPAYMALGGMLMREDGARAALKVYQEGYEHTRDESFLPRIESVCIVHLEDPRRAIDHFSHLVERDPKSLRLRYWLGRVYERLEMIDDAVSVLSQVEQAVDRFPELQALLARINLRRQAYGAALDALGEGSPPVAYHCGACDTPATAWVARCPACGRWGTVAPSLHITARPEPSPGPAAPLLPAPA